MLAIELLEDDENDDDRRLDVEQLLSAQLFFNRMLLAICCCFSATPVVNFINILRTDFATIFLLPQKLQSQTITREKLRKTL